MLYFLVPVLIARGGSVPLTVENGVMRVNVGATVYTLNGLTIAISCNVIAGEVPLTLSWYHNGELDQSRGNFSTIKVTDAKHNDVFACRVENGMDFHQEDTVILYLRAVANNTFCIHSP